jgi:threonine dehydratase
MKTKIIWVEPEGAASMKLSLEKWENTALDKINTFVDGASVKKVWDIPFEIAKEYVPHFLNTQMKMVFL